MTLQEPSKLGHLILATIAIVVTCVGGMWTMIEAHAKAPHADAIHVRELSLLRDLIEAEHAALRAQLRTIEQGVEANRAVLLTLPKKESR